MYDVPAIKNAMNAWSEIKDDACEQEQDCSVSATSKEKLYHFWYSEIETLSADNFNKAAMLFYINVFELIPEISPKFSKSIELQAKQYFGMIRWLIANLKQPDNHRVKSRIRILGVLHQKLNVKEDWFTAFLQAFHEAMHDTVGERYTPQIQFCMEQLYTVVTSIMLGKDFESMPPSQAAKLLKSLGSIQDCLKDADAKQYLEMYMKEQFCVEWMHLYTDYRRYKSCSSFMTRQQIASGIMKKYIGANAECSVNVSHATKKGIYQSLRENHSVFVMDVFDEMATECIETMNNEIWTGFKHAVTNMAMAPNPSLNAVTGSKSQSISYR
eukprot:CAMPEP_0197021480 /NCGR_PEP_ID=MMETSP1384-20130603/2366_1 /TAXON_ID=29189 /ORGANISM="Ammonia sp." /LENGTH=326 /DNA_ID=CAMNT_0042449315 /DNA_START=217 /DNA_END=1197 /DNA_ORIENTATION=+